MAPNALQRFLIRLGLRAPAQPSPRVLSRTSLLAGRPTVEAGAYRDWRSIWNLIGRRTAQTSAPLDLLRYIRDYDPDAAMAIWNFIRMASRIEDITVYRAGQGQDKDEVDEAGQDLIDALNDPSAGTIGIEYGGGLANLAAVLTLSVMTQGALALEVGLEPGLRSVSGFFPVNPGLIDFVLDEDRVPHPVIANVGGEPTRINELQFRYVPMDPDVDDPLGRSPMWPAIAAIEFKTEVLRDLKAVAHNQGHARIDVTVLEEVVLENLKTTRPDLFMPGNEAALQAQLDGFISDLQTSYNALHPDDTFIHYNTLTVSSAGANHSGSIDFSALMETIDRQVVAAMKSLPILIGRNDSATTTHATVQWQIFALTIEAIQDKLETVLEWACNLALQVAGIQAVTDIVFEAPRKSDRTADVTADKIETETWIMRINQGWASAEEASMAVLGHSPAEEKQEPPAPVVVAPGEQPPAEGAPADQAPTEEGAPPDEEPRILGRALRDTLRAQIGDDYASEANELFATPLWMQYLVTQADQELGLAHRTHMLNAYQTLVSLPDAEWEAALAADAKEAGRGHGGNGSGST